MLYSRAAFVGICVLFYSQLTYSVELSGKLDLEVRYYFDEGQYREQDYHWNNSLTLEPEFYWNWNDRNDSLVIKPFGRIDQRDDERSHGDIREFSWVHVNGKWEWRTGIRKVFWGVTEFVHLVDVINQTDAVDAFDGEKKLGQPMINLSYVSDVGIFDAFALIGFRERTFAGEEGRLRSGILVDANRTTYEASEEEKHIDYALRWYYSVGFFDLGAYVFHGTDREPILQARLVDGDLTLIPYYQQVSQVGLDIQATVGSWLLKFEALNKDSDLDNYLASQLGFEYTFYGINQSAKDIGVLLEYGWDERDEDASSISQNDIYLGARLTFNDVNDTTLLMGVSYDADYYTKSFLIEASRRLNDHWTISIEGLFFDASNTSDPVFAVREDDHIQLTLERYF